MVPSTSNYSLRQLGVGFRVSYKLSNYIHRESTMDHWTAFCLPAIQVSHGQDRWPNHRLNRTIASSAAQYADEHDPDAALPFHIQRNKIEDVNFSRISQIEAIWSILGSKYLRIQSGRPLDNYTNIKITLGSIALVNFFTFLVLRTLVLFLLAGLESETPLVQSRHTWGYGNFDEDNLSHLHKVFQDVEDHYKTC